MAGHNKWSKIKRSKGVLDVKRGTLFSKLSKEITIAAKNGGGDVSLNPRLRSAIQGARAQNMPNDKIDRAIKKGTGDLEGQALEELTYEGYAPGGVAILLEALTDNRNRTAAELRLIFSKYHGNLGTSGSVGYLFHKKGQISISKAANPAARASEEERILELALEAGADEFEAEEERYLITTPPDRLYSVADALKAGGIVAETLKLTYLPENSIAVSDQTVAGQILNLCDALDDFDDVHHVYSNFDISDDLLSRLSA